MSAGTKCSGDHDYFVADVAQVTVEGKIVITAICKLCGNLVNHHVKVTG